MNKFKNLLPFKVLFIAVTVLFLTSCEEDYPHANTQPIIENNDLETPTHTMLDIAGRGEDLLADVDALLPAIITPTNGIDYYEVIYNTVGLDGNLTQASGGLAVPTNFDGTSPIATYCHGTSIRDDNTPSQLNQESNIGIIFSSEGFVVVLPDYLGYGPSDGIHPYHHADSEASATIDMIRASKQILDELENAYNDQLFVFGYSQGGHAAMATVKTIEERYSNEFTVTAAAPMSGAYDLSGIQATTFEQDIPYGAPYYLPFILLGYNSVYNIYPEYSDFLNSPWDEQLPPLFDGTHSPGEINAIMPEFPNDIIKDEVFDGFLNNPNHIFRQMLRANSLINYSPATPMRIMYCNGDPLVLFQNSELACAEYSNNSSAEIECVDFGAFDHSGCVLPCLLNARGWFKDLAEF